MKNKLFALAVALSASIWSVSAHAAALESPETQAAAQALVKGARAAVGQVAVPGSDDAVGEEEPGAVTDDEASRPPTRVSEGVWRSSRPNTTALELLYGMGVKTILNLEGGGPYADEKKDLRQIEEKRAADGQPSWHITSEAVPMSGIGKPSFEQIDRALAALADPDRRPILVHCKHGEDRTGVVVAAYRTEIEKRMTLDEAVEEAKSMNCCHLVLVGKNGLRDFLRDYHEHRQGKL
jgi:protein tyrosine phosphatase (PTP) superfamily phosphohydrolase (DUF442 family)